MSLYMGLAALRTSVVALSMTALAFPVRNKPPKLTITHKSGVQAAVIEFPSWTSQEGTGLYGYGYTLRVPKAGSGGEFLIRAERPHHPSIERYRVGLQDSFPVGPASLEEWEAAAPVERTEGGHSQLTGESAPESTFQGKAYTKTGQLWRGPRVAPDGRWILLHSYDDADWIKYRPKTILGQGSPHTGATYFELRDTATGQPLLIARTRRWDDIIFESDSFQWAGERLLLLGFRGRGAVGEKCLIIREASGRRPSRPLPDSDLCRGPVGGRQCRWRRRPSRAYSNLGCSARRDIRTSCPPRRSTARQ